MDTEMDFCWQRAPGRGGEGRDDACSSFSLLCPRTSPFHQISFQETLPEPLGLEQCQDWVGGGCAQGSPALPSSSRACPIEFPGILGTISQHQKGQISQSSDPTPRMTDITPMDVEPTAAAAARNPLGFGCGIPGPQSSPEGQSHHPKSLHHRKHSPESPSHGAPELEIKVIFSI